MVDRDNDLRSHTRHTNADVLIGVGGPFLFYMGLVRS